MTKETNQIIIARLKREFRAIKKRNNIQEIYIFECVLNRYMKEPTQENRNLNDTVKILRGKCSYLINGYYYKRT